MNYIFYLFISFENVNQNINSRQGKPLLLMPISGFRYSASPANLIVHILISLYLQEVIYYLSLHDYETTTNFLKISYVFRILKKLSMVM